MENNKRQRYGEGIILACETAITLSNIGYEICLTYHYLIKLVPDHPLRREWEKKIDLCREFDDYGIMEIYRLSSKEVACQKLNVANAILNEALAIEEDEMLIKSYETNIRPYPIPDELPDVPDYLKGDSEFPEDGIEDCCR